MFVQFALINLVYEVCESCYIILGLYIIFYADDSLSFVLGCSMPIVIFNFAMLSFMQILIYEYCIMYIYFTLLAYHSLHLVLYIILWMLFCCSWSVHSVLCIYHLFFPFNTLFCVSHSKHLDLLYHLRILLYIAFYAPSNMQIILWNWFAPVHFTKLLNLFYHLPFTI